MLLVGVLRPHDFQLHIRSIPHARCRFEVILATTTSRSCVAATSFWLKLRTSKAWLRRATSKLTSPHAPANFCPWPCGVTISFSLGNSKILEVHCRLGGSMLLNRGRQVSESDQVSTKRRKQLSELLERHSPNRAKLLSRKQVAHATLIGTNHTNHDTHRSKAVIFAQIATRVVQWHRKSYGSQHHRSKVDKPRIAHPNSCLNLCMRCGL